MLGERRSGVDFEQVEREMLRLQFKRSIDVLLPTNERLSGQSGDQVETDVLETRGTQFMKRFQGVGGRMRSTQLCEFTVVERLRAEAGAVDAEISEHAKLIARDSPGIHLHRDFGIRLHCESFVNGRQDAIELRGSQQRRR